MLSRTTPAIALAVLTCAGALAQELYVVSGRAVDARGGAVPAATIRLASGGAGPAVETLTELDGSFGFANLPAATYRITAEMTGFRDIAVDVDAASDASRALVLRFERAVPPPPRAAEAPTATAPANSAGAPAAAEPSGRPPQPNARRGAPEGAAPSARFQEVGVLNAPGGDALASAAPEEPAAQRPEGDVLLISGSSGATIDMGDFNDPQFRERMAEMAGRMGFGGFRSDEGGDGGGAREFGGFGVRFAGGGGFGPGGGPGGGDRGRFGGRGGRGAQPRLNGSIQATYRNSALNARPYSITGNEVAKPLQIGNSFGASFGGPLPWGPKSSGSTGRARIAQQPGMWFFSYEGSRNRNPYDALTTVPTELERTGDFSQTSLRAGPLAGRVVDLYDPLTGAPFPEGRIPASRIDPVASALLGYVPPPNLPGAVQNFTLQRGLLGTSDSFSARFATRLSTKHNIFASYSLRTSDGISSQHFLGLDTDRATRSQNAMLGGMVRFQPRLIANYRVTFNRVRSLSSNPFAFVDDVAGKLGITGVSREPINYGIPTINFTNYGDLQLGSPSLTRTQTFGGGAGMNKIGTKHSIQIGAGFNRNQRNSQVDPNARGTFDFTGFATSAFDDRGRPVSGTGHDLADFLLGLPYSTSRRFGSANNYLRNTSFNVFAQDNWRLRSNLTVNFGLRYEYNGPYYEKYDRMVTLDPAPGFTAVAQAFPDTQGAYSGHFPRSLARPDRNNFGPRIGIAWKPKATSRWVFRTGYGLFYNPSVYSTIASQLVGQPPFAVSQNILTSLEQPLTMASGFPTDPEVTILNSYAIDPDYRIGYVQQWNLNLQTQVRRLYTVEVGYNGTKGTRLDILRAPNRAPAGSSPGDTEGNRTISNAGNFVYQGSGANSILHSLRVRANRRFSRGFRIENSYTLGKSIDNASGIGGGGLVVVQDERNIAGERSRSSFDRRHRFESELNIDLPFGTRRRFLAGAPPLVQGLVGGWSINGDYELFSGTPLTARILGNQSNNSGTGSSGSERPDATGAAVALSGGERTTSRFFNTAAFALPAAGRFGNAGRYTISGPGTNLLDLSLRKSFRLDDNNRRVELRWSVENVLNHPNFGGVGTVVNALNFGRVTSARSMRQMVFNLRITF